ncbi:MAG: hypothetical protein PHS48_11030 [Bacteroidales bacterium]|nr:hypothetical protein [Bacteroidales bacterium]
MIELAKANPDIETLKLTLWIASAVIALLLTSVIGVVVYLAKKQINVSEMLTNAVNKLTVAVSVLENQNKDRYPVIERRLNDHARRLDQHDKQIVRIETTLKL